MYRPKNNDVTSCDRSDTYDRGDRSDDTGAPGLSICCEKNYTEFNILKWIKLKMQEKWKYLKTFKYKTLETND